jgi:hypothetical protein
MKRAWVTVLCGPESDIGCCDDDRYDQKLDEAKPAARERSGYAYHRHKPHEIHRNHHRPLAAELRHGPVEPPPPPEPPSPNPGWIHDRRCL